MAEVIAIIYVFTFVLSCIIRQMRLENVEKHSEGRSGDHAQGNIEVFGNAMLDTEKKVLWDAITGISRKEKMF